MSKTLLWFRADLRLSDNPALVAAAKRGDIVPVFIRDETAEQGDFSAPGGASQWWLHHALTALENDLGGVVYRTGEPQKVLRDLLGETDADAVFWNRQYEPHAIKRDKAIKEQLRRDGFEAESFNASLLVEPWEVETKTGGPYKVFTPFWRAIKAMDHDAPLNKPRDITLAKLPKSESLADWRLLPQKPDWAKGWNRIWTPGEQGAKNRLSAFIDRQLKGYGTGRDRAGTNATSRLSPHLHFGELSPRQIWSAILFASEEDSALSQDADKFISELAWREFSTHLLYHFPELPRENFKEAFNAFSWSRSEKHLEAWQKGRTGYPMVDAGMRELWQTGYMHNRVRMITASFLIKHLRIDWRRGQDWFWDCLVDADLANNAASWQWVAGSGADASPYFRIFNPMTQGEKFDPNGDYVRRWCPELKKLPTEFIHAPFNAPYDVLKKAGVELGKTYPHPLVDHKQAREKALAAYADVKKAGQAES